MLEQIRAKHKLPGLGAVVLHGDTVVSEGVAGVRKAGATEAVISTDKFHLGSDTKAMTATLLAMLVEEGKLKRNTTIGEVFGGLVPDMDAGWKPVTLAQLLTHRGGAPADLHAGGLWTQLRERKGTPTDQRQQLVKGVLARPPATQPGVQYIYSNAGYAIAGAMAENVMKQAWEDLTRERLFKPLGITTGGFGPPGMSGKRDQPLGHTADGKPVEPGPRADNPPAIGPAGTVHMSLADWGKFISLHLRGDANNPNRETKLLKPETFDWLHRAADGSGDRYACGWGVKQRAWAKGDKAGASGGVLAHGGSNTMWFCIVWIAPERDFAVLVACNQGGDVAAKACDEVAAELIKQHAPQ